MTVLDPRFLPSSSSSYLPRLRVQHSIRLRPSSAFGAALFDSRPSLRHAFRASLASPSSSRTNYQRLHTFCASFWVLGSCRLQADCLHPPQTMPSSRSRSSSSIMTSSGSSTSASGFFSRFRKTKARQEPVVFEVVQPVYRGLSRSRLALHLPAR